MYGTMMMENRDVAPRDLLPERDLDLNKTVFADVTEPYASDDAEHFVTSEPAVLFGSGCCTMSCLLS